MPFEVPGDGPCSFCLNIAGLPVVSRVDGEIVGCAAIEALNQTFAFINPYQFSPPHILVIPTRHVETILDLTGDEAAAIMRHVHRLARAVVHAYEPIGLNIFQNNGTAAGQSEGHFHVHLVPRYPDEVPLPRSSRGLPRLPLSDREDQAERLRAALLAIGGTCRATSRRQ